MARGGKYRDGRRNNRPPGEFQFKAGQSGNNKGRPKKPPPSLVELIAAELNTKHLLEVGGNQVEVPLKVVLIRQVIRLACKGHPKALIWALEMVELVQQTEVKRHASEDAYTQIRPEDLRKMSETELRDLYMQSLNEAGREPLLDYSEGFPGKLKK
jgi:hypothetical protein